MIFDIFECFRFAVVTMSLKITRILGYTRTTNANACDSEIGIICFKSLVISSSNLDILFEKPLASQPRGQGFDPHSLQKAGGPFLPLVEPEAASLP